MQSWCYQTSVTPYRCSLGATKTPSHPTDAVLVLPNHQYTLKMQSWYYQTSVTPWRCSLGATKPPAHHEDGGKVSFRKVGKLSSWRDSPRKFHGKAPCSFEISIIPHPKTQRHKLDVLQIALTASLTSKHDSHVTYISDSANKKDTEKHELYCCGPLSYMATALPSHYCLRQTDWSLLARRVKRQAGRGWGVGDRASSSKHLLYVSKTLSRNPQDSAVSLRQFNF